MECSYREHCPCLQLDLAWTECPAGSNAGQTAKGIKGPSKEEKKGSSAPCTPGSEAGPAGTWAGGSSSDLLGPPSDPAKLWDQALLWLFEGPSAAHPPLMAAGKATAEREDVSRAVTKPAGPVSSVAVSRETFQQKAILREAQPPAKSNAAWRLLPCCHLSGMPAPLYSPSLIATSPSAPHLKITCFARPEAGPSPFLGPAFPTPWVALGDPSSASPGSPRAEQIHAGLRHPALASRGSKLPHEPGSMSIWGLLECHHKAPARSPMKGSPSWPELLWDHLRCCS